MINLAYEWVFLCTPHVSPLVVAVGVLQEEAVLVPSHIVGLTRVPVCVRDRVVGTLVCPLKLTLHTLVITARVETILTYRLQTFTK